jgi:hypothetical protein
MKVWVKAAPHPDPALAGKSICRKRGIGRVNRFFTETPELVEFEGEIPRLVASGDLVRCEPPEEQEQEP